MIVKLSKSLLLMIGLIALCLPLCTVIYMTFFWSPVRIKGDQIIWQVPVGHENLSHDDKLLTGNERSDEIVTLSTLHAKASYYTNNTGSDRNTSKGYENDNVQNVLAAAARDALPAVSFNLSLANTNYSRQWKKRDWKPTKMIRNPKNLPPSWESASAEEKNATKYLCYICDAWALCGGWGDRQRALTSVYIWARVIRRKFKLIMTTPCNLSDFYVPNKVDWLLSNDKLEPATSANTINSRESWKRLHQTDLNLAYPERVVYVRTSSDMYAHVVGNAAYANVTRSWSGLRDLRSRFFWAWHELMKPSPGFTDRLEAILGSGFLLRKGLQPRVSAQPVTPLQEVGNSSLICAHVRVGKNPSNPRDEPFIAVTGEDIPVLLHFMKGKDQKGTAKFFIATDYINVRLQAKQFFGPSYIDYGGRISHTDRDRKDKDACLGFESTLLDQMILSLCDVLITSRSGFSVRASHMRNSTEPVYVIDGGEVKVAEE